MNTLTYSGVRCLEDGRIEFAKGITAIIGGNGVGKSTLAQAVVESLGGRRRLEDRPTDRRLAGATIAAEVEEQGVRRTIHLSVDADGVRDTGTSDIEGLVTWLDPSELALMCQKQIAGDNSFHEILEPLGPHRLDEDELNSASRLVGKSYTGCTVWEIQDYGLYPVLPYFRVECNGVEYGSENMGRGELALLIAQWSLARVKNNSIVVLEEPENYISPRSQERLMDLVAKACDKQGIWVIVTTHSPVVVERIPRNNIRLLTNAGRKSTLQSNPLAHQTAAILGGAVGRRSLLLTEDECARFFTLAICDALDSDLRHKAEVVSVGGYSEIDRILQAVPKVDGWGCNLVGVFDGDERARRRENLHWPHVFLPGAVPPEELLRGSLADDEGIEEVASLLNVRPNQVHVALDAAMGLDCHDWHETFAQIIGPDKAAVTRALSRLWIQTNEDQAVAFVKNLLIAVG